MNDAESFAISKLDFTNNSFINQILEHNSVADTADDTVEFASYDSDLESGCLVWLQVSRTASRNRK
jgi:hypothetical protein